MTEESLKRKSFEVFLFSSFGEVPNKIFTIGASAILLANLSPYEYGVWQLLLSVVTFFGILMFNGVSGIVVAEIGRELGKKRPEVAASIAWYTSIGFLLAGAASTVALLVAAPIVTHYSRIDLTFYLSLIAFTLVANSAEQVCLNILQAYVRPGHAQILKNIGAVTYFVAILALVWYLHAGVLGLVIAYLIAAIVPPIIYIPVILHQLRDVLALKSHGAFSFGDQVWQQGKWAIASDWISTAISSLWPWLVGLYINISTIGMIAIAITLLSQVAGFIPLSYVLRSFLPRISEDQARMREWIVRGMRYSVFLYLLGALGILIAALVIFPFVFPKYVEAIPVYMGLMLALIARGPSLVLGEYFYATKTQQRLFAAKTIPQLLLLPVLVLLLMFLKIKGFIIWFILTDVFVFLSLVREVQRSTGPLPWRHILQPSAEDKQLVGTLKSWAFAKFGK